MSLKTLYTQVRNQIECEVKKIKHVRLYNSQFANERQEHAFKYPAVFIEFSNIDWQNKQQGVQEGAVTVTLYQGFQSLQDEDIDILDIVKQVYAAMQGFQGECFTPFSRLSETQDSNHNNVIVWRTDYITQLTDDAGHIKQGLPTATITDIEVNRDIDIDNQTLRLGDGEF